MKTYIECLPCFFRQAIDACKKAELSEKETKKIIEKAAKVIKKIPMDVPRKKKIGTTKHVKRF